MGVGRAHDHRMRQLRQTYIVGKAASAGEETKILLAPHRLTNAVRHVARRVHARYSTDIMTRSLAGLIGFGCRPHRY